MFELKGIRRSFGENHVLKGTDLKIPRGEVSGLIGPSGSGKSVLLKIMGGILLPDSGSIDFPKDSSTRIGLMFQEGALFDSLNVFDNVAFPLVDGRVPSASLPRAKLKNIGESVYHILSRVGLSRAAFKMPGQLSGGMRRRVSLARALVSKPDLVLLDDPTAGLDPVASSIIMNLILELHAEYRPTLLMISHDLRRLLPVVGSVLALFDGQIIFTGNLHELAQSENEELMRFVKCRFDFNGCGTET